jgi:hypothetical protein
MRVQIQTTSAEHQARLKNHKNMQLVPF